MPDMENSYLQLITHIERLHRRFLDVVKADIEQLELNDINNVQALLLYNIGKETVTVGDLMNRGYYLGSNVSYNVKKLVESGYLRIEKARHDRRSNKVSVTEKGHIVTHRIALLMARQRAAMTSRGLDEPQLDAANRVLSSIDEYWSFFLLHLPSKY